MSLLAAVGILEDSYQVVFVISDAGIVNIISNGVKHPLT